MYPYMDKKEAGLAHFSKPFLHGDTNELDFKVEGVSDKQFPIMLQWERPRHVQRWEPHPEGAGDGEALMSLDPMTPKWDLESLPEYQEASEVVKKALSVEYARNNEVTNKVKGEF